MTSSPPIAAHLQREGEAAAVRVGAAQLHALGRLQLGGDGGGHHLAAQRGLGVRVHQQSQHFNIDSFVVKAPTMALFTLSTRKVASSHYCTLNKRAKSININKIKTINRCEKRNIEKAFKILG